MQLSDVQGSINAVQKNCGCLFVTSVASYKVYSYSLPSLSPAVTIATDDIDKSSATNIPQLSSDLSPVIYLFTANTVGKA